MAEAVNLYNVNDGMTGRTGGPYLDEEQARAAEVRRAVVEDRKPDLDGIQPYAGIQLVPAATLLQQINVNNTPSEDGKFELAKALDESQYGAPVAAKVILDETSEEAVSGSVSTKSEGREGRRS